MHLTSRLRLFFGLLALTFLVVAAPAGASDVVISQFRTHGTGGDFVEIQNVTSPPRTVNLGVDWSITYFDTVFSSGCTIYGDYTNPSSIPAFNAFRPPVTLAPGQRFLVTQPGNWTGTGDAATDESFHAQAHGECGQIPDTAGFLNFSPGGSNGTDRITGVPLAADQVSYGPIPGVPPTPSDPFWGSSASYVNEPDPIPAASVPSDGRALRRKVVGTQDTNSNKNDFEAVTADPRNSIATAPAPDAATTDATSIAARTATLTGTVNPHRAAVTDCKFQIDTTGTYTSPVVVPCTPATPVGQTDLPVTGAAGATTALTPDTVYHYRVMVSTAKGTKTAAERTFRTTPPDPPPDGSTQPATTVTARSTILNGKINPHNGTISDCHFDYTKTASGAPTLHVPCTTAPTGTNLVDVTAPVIDLDPSSDYGYHLVVTTENGTFTGSPNATFTTSALGTADTDKVVISQFRTQGPGGDFVELANVTNSTLTLAPGWSLSASTANSGCSIINPQSGPQVTLAPGQHYLVGGVTGADLGFASGPGRCGGDLPNTNAMLSLLVTEATTFGLLSFDSAAYGSFLSASEGPAVPVVPSDGKALQRRANGTQDTHRNADDFTVVSAAPAGLAASSPSPAVMTGTPTALLQTTATLTGTVNPQGGTVTNCHFDYGLATNSSYGSSIPCATTPAGTTPSTVTAPVTGLTQATDYHARLLVTTTGHTPVDGGDVPFRTADPLPVPTGTTENATNVASATATLNAKVNPHGAGISSCSFDYGTTSSYTSSIPCSPTPSGSNSVDVLAQITDLAPSQTYHYSVHVVGANGNLLNLDKSFTTSAVVPDDDKIVISQFRTQGIANGDFVELLNVSDQVVDLQAGDWAIVGLAPDGNSACAIVSSTTAPAVTLAPGQHYLVTQSGWTGTGTSQSDLTFFSGSGACGHIIDTAGVLALSGGGSDQVAYGSFPPSGATVSEPDAIPSVPTDGKALQRRDSGVRDTGNNYDDFRPVAAAPTHFLPQAASAITDPAAVLGSAKATFQGRVRPQGETITGCEFKYGTGADFATANPYPSSAPCNTTPTGLGTVSVSATKTNLAPSTGYHFKLVAHGSTTGDIGGVDRSFTTSDPPTAATNDADSYGSRSATAHATVNPRGETVTDCHFDYGTTDSYGSTKPCVPTPSGSGDAFPSAALTGLAPATVYHVRVHITTAVAGELTGGDKSFATTAKPSATTADAGAVGHSVATLNGTVNPRGETVTNCHFEYGTTGSYGTSVPCVGSPSGLDPVAVSAQLSGLPATTAYHYRLMVTTNGDSANPIDGGDREFSTTTPPAASTDDHFTGVGSRSAVLGGTVNPHGETVTQCRFEYSTDASFGSFVPCAHTLPFTGTSDEPVSATVTGLAPSTDYKVRLFIVTSSSGRTDGATRTLSTTTTPSATSDQAGGIAHRAATLKGTVNPHGETVTDCHFEYGPTGSYGTSVPCASTPSGNDPSPVSAAISGLTPGTGYHAHVVITTDGAPTAPVDGGDSQFTTADPASAATDPVGDIRARSATLTGTVSPHGETITGCHFEYGPDTSYGSTKPCASMPSGLGSSPVSAALTGLTPGAVYHAHVLITTAGGGATPIDGGDQHFTAAAPAAAATDAAGDLAVASATLNGTVTPNGETITDCHFDYGPDANYGSTKPCASTPPGSTATPVSAALTGLTASTTYHYRVIVTTDGGGSPLAGGDRQFATAAPPNQTGSAGNPGGSAGNPGGSAGTPGGPGDTGLLTPLQLAAVAGLGGTKTAGSDGTVKLGQLSCPLVCGKVEVTATIPSAGAASAKKPRKPVVVGKGSTTVAKGHSRKLAFKLTAQGRKAASKAKGKKLKTTVTVLVTDASGKRVKATRAIVVKAPKRWH